MNASARHWIRPRPLPLIVAIGAVLTLLGLGCWQMQRLAWKEGLIAEIAQAAQQPLARLPKDEPTIRAMGFRLVRLDGHFLNDHEFHLAARYERGTLGFHILTPFQLDDGRVVLLNRGWVPLEKKDAAKRPEGQIAGEVGITGMIRPDKDRNPFTPEADVMRNMWFFKDIEGMRNASGLAIEPIPLDVVGEPVPGGYPKAFDGNITLRNDHLGYALTWFALAFAAAVIFALCHSKPVEEGKDAAL